MLFGLSRDRIFPGSPRGVHIFCFFSLVVYLCFLMNTGKEESIINSRFFFRWIIIIFFLFKQFHYFIDRCFFSVLYFLFSCTHQQIANGILMATAAAIGLLFYFLGETKQRRAFLEAKQSLEVKMVIEEQSAEQVRNIFPKSI